MIMDLINVSDRIESLVRRIDMFNKSREDIKLELKDLVSDIKAEVDRHFNQMAEEHGQLEVDPIDDFNYVGSRHHY